MNPRYRRVIEGVVNATAVITVAVVYRHEVWMWLIPLGTILLTEGFEFVLARREEKKVAEVERRLRDKIAELESSDSGLKQRLTEASEVMPILQVIRKTADGSRQSWYASFKNSCERRILVAMAEKEQWLSGDLPRRLKDANSEIGRIVDSWIDHGVVEVKNANDYGGVSIRIMRPSPGFNASLVLAITNDWSTRVKSILDETL